jgi:hypothetical protein
VAGGDGALVFWAPWSPDLKEGAGGGDGPTMLVVWPAEGKAVRERCQSGRAGTSVGGAVGGGDGEQGERRQWWRAAAEAPPEPWEAGEQGQNRGGRRSAGEVWEQGQNRGGRRRSQGGGGARSE